VLAAPIDVHVVPGPEPVVGMGYARQEGLGTNFADDGLISSSDR
jgi:hypothetical protein